MTKTQRLGILAAGLLGACSADAEPPVNSDLRVFADRSADLLFGQNAAIDHVPAWEVANAQIWEAGRCQETPSVEHRALPSLVRRAGDFGSVSFSPHCALGREGHLADSRRHNARPNSVKASLLIIDVVPRRLAKSYADVLGAGRIDEGYFRANASECQLYLGSAAGRVDLIVLKVASRTGTQIDIDDARHRECFSRAALRAFGLVGASYLPASSLFRANPSRDCSAMSNSCDTIRNEFPYRYLESLSRRGLLKSGTVRRSAFEATILRDPEAAGFADLYRSTEARLKNPQPIPVPKTRAF